MTITEWSVVKELTDRLEAIKREENEIQTKLNAIRSILNDSTSSKTSSRGPLPRRTHEERIKKILSCMKLNGGKDISVNIIATYVRMSRGAVLNYMTRRLLRLDCPWKKGKLATWFTLKEID